jgi:hypothetical protein
MTKKGDDENGYLQEICVRDFGTKIVPYYF